MRRALKAVRKDLVIKKERLATKREPAEHAGPPRSSPEKYQRILESAVAVFAERGFHHSRVSDVATRAGVADGTIYLYFKNKEEILMAAINSAFEGFMTHARKEIAEIPSPVDKLRRLAFLHLEALGANRNLAIVFQMELRQSVRFLEAFSHHQMLDYFGLVRECIREGQQQGLMRPELHEKFAANCFFGALDEMVTSWVLADHDYPLAQAAETVSDIILKGLAK
ncbi:MAG TPA: TetR/AcrR family transcriptional regulator [Terriglobales bacterium]